MRASGLRFDRGSNGLRLAGRGEPGRGDPKLGRLQFGLEQNQLVLELPRWR